MSETWTGTRFASPPESGPSGSPAHFLWKGKDLKLLVLGANGRTRKIVLEAVLAMDMDVTAVVVPRTGQPEGRVRRIVADPQMHLHMAPAGAGMTLLAIWTPSVVPDLQRYPGAALDQRRSTRILLHGGLRRMRRVRRLVDYVGEALFERCAGFIG